jgi:hypothetical protein
MYRLGASQKHTPHNEWQNGSIYTSSCSASVYAPHCTSHTKAKEKNSVVSSYPSVKFFYKVVKIRKIGLIKYVQLAEFEYDFNCIQTLDGAHLQHRNGLFTRTW